MGEKKKLPGIASASSSYASVVLLWRQPWSSIRGTVWHREKDKNHARIGMKINACLCLQHEFLEKICFRHEFLEHSDLRSVLQRFRCTKVESTTGVKQLLSDHPYYLTGNNAKLLVAPALPLIEVVRHCNYTLSNSYLLWVWALFCVLGWGTVEVPIYSAPKASFLHARFVANFVSMQNDKHCLTGQQ